MSSSLCYHGLLQKMPFLITVIIFSVLLLPPTPVLTLPTFSLVDSTSRLFPYRTNFFQALRLKSRLARSPTRNVAAVLAALAEEEAAAADASRGEEYGDGESSLTLYSLSDPMKKKATTTTTEIPEQIDGIEVEETPIESPSSPASQTPVQCGIPSSRMLNSLLLPDRRGRIVGGEVVHHGEYPWMVSRNDSGDVAE